MTHLPRDASLIQEALQKFASANDLEFAWQRPELLCLNAAGEHASICIDFPDAYWTRWESVEEVSKAEAVAGLVSTVVTVYNPRFRGREMQSVEADPGSLID